MTSRRYSLSSKSKMHDRKSWASSPRVKKSHAIFGCLSRHLLLLLFEKQTEETELRSHEVLRHRVHGRRERRDGRGELPPLNGTTSRE